MKIALSADGRSPHTERWANALDARGHELTLIWPSERVDAVALSRYGSNVQHLACESRIPWPTKQPCMLERMKPTSIAKRLRPDVVQGMNLVSYGWTAADLGRPLVQFALGSDAVTLGALPVTTRRRLLGNAYRRWRTINAVKRADIVFCDSTAIAGVLHTHVPDARVELIRIGVELSAAPSGREWRSELGIARDAFVLLSTRLLTPNYNIVTIIRAFASVLERIPGCVLVLKDFESFGDDSYRASCHRLIAELGVASSIRHVGELDRADVLSLYRAADVFVSVPTNDSTAVSVLEAMSASVPVVASQTLGMDAAVLRAGDSALLVPPGDSSALAAAVIGLYGSPQLRDRLGQAGKETARAIGDFDREIGRAERFYVELVGRG